MNVSIYMHTRGHMKVPKKHFLQQFMNMCVYIICIYTHAYTYTNKHVTFLWQVLPAKERPLCYCGPGCLRCRSGAETARKLTSEQRRSFSLRRTSDAENEYVSSNNTSVDSANLNLSHSEGHAKGDTPPGVRMHGSNGEDDAESRVVGRSASLRHDAHDVSAAQSQPPHESRRAGDDDDGVIMNASNVDVAHSARQNDADKHKECATQDHGQIDATSVNDAVRRAHSSGDGAHVQGQGNTSYDHSNETADSESNNKDGRGSGQGAVRRSLGFDSAQNKSVTVQNITILDGGGTQGGEEETATQRKVHGGDQDTCVGGGEKRAEKEDLERECRQAEDGGAPREDSSAENEVLEEDGRLVRLGEEDTNKDDETSVTREHAVDSCTTKTIDSERDGETGSQHTSTGTHGNLGNDSIASSDGNAGGEHMCSQQHTDGNHHHHDKGSDCHSLHAPPAGSAGAPANICDGALSESGAKSRSSEVPQDTSVKAAVGAQHGDKSVSESEELRLNVDRMTDSGCMPRDSIVDSGVEPLSPSHTAHIPNTSPWPKLQANTSFRHQQHMPAHGDTSHHAHVDAADEMARNRSSLDEAYLSSDAASKRIRELASESLNHVQGFPFSPATLKRSSTELIVADSGVIRMRSQHPVDTVARPIIKLDYSKRLQGQILTRR
jgi:hypothetical protein